MQAAARSSAGSMRVQASLLAVLLFGSILGGILLHAMAAPRYNHSVLDSTKSVLTMNSLIDSWLPMGNALQTWRSPAGHDIYARVFFAPVDAYQYPPAALFFAMALGMSPSKVPSLPETLSLLFSMAIVAVGTAYILERMMALKGLALGGPAQRLFRAALVAALMLTFYPIVRAFELGQAQLWIDAAFTLALALWLRGNPATSGVLIGLACLIKPQLGLLLVWAFLRKEWRFAAGLAAFCACALGISLLYFGVENHLSYLNVLSYLSEHGESYKANQSVNGLLGRLMSLREPDMFNNMQWRESLPPYNPMVYIGTVISSLVILVPALFWRSENARLPRTLDFCIMAVSSTMASPIAWEHHYGIIFPIYALAMVAAWSRPAALTALAVSYVIASHYISITGKFAHSELNFVQSYLFFATLLLLSVMYLLRLRSQESASSLRVDPIRVAP
jgi:alpha-1,2-mannosyltransferase